MKWYYRLLHATNGVGRAMQRWEMIAWIEAIVVIYTTTVTIFVTKDVIDINAKLYLTNHTALIM